jgi:Ca-activated chloride channel homolog
MSNGAWHKVFRAGTILLMIAGSMLGGDTPANSKPRTKRNAQRELATSLRVHSSLVLIPLSVTDRLNRPVLGLTKTDFRLFDRNQEQQILHVSFEDAPLAVGLIFDSSASMVRKMTKARAAVTQFLKTANPEDEFFLVEFGTKARLVQGLTPDTADIQAGLSSTVAKGKTALFDAVAIGLKELKKSSKPRKALVLISDGGDNSSRFTHPEVRNLLRESDANLYALGVFESGADHLAAEQIEAPWVLEDLAEASGGRMYTVHNINNLPAMTERIGVELHNRYVLGYVPGNLTHDGKYHPVKVRVVAGDRGAPLHVESRAGYRAPE